MEENTDVRILNNKPVAKKSNMKVVKTEETKAPPVEQNAPAKMSMFDLERQLMEARKAQVQKNETIAKAVAELADKHSVKIGVQLSIEKISDILNYMIEHRVRLVDVQFEVWGVEE